MSYVTEPSDLQCYQRNACQYLARN